MRNITVLECVICIPSLTVTIETHSETIYTRSKALILGLLYIQCFLKIIIIIESLNRHRLAKAASDLERFALNIVPILRYICKMLVKFVVNGESLNRCCLTKVCLIWNCAVIDKSFNVCVNYPSF